MTNEKIYSPGDYVNLLDRINLSSDEIFTIIEPFSLAFPQTRNQAVEWGIKLPMFVDAFYNFVIQHNTIPTQKAFYDYYLFKNQIFFTENRFDSSIHDGLLARVYRTYPSLVRDLYFNLYAKENIADANIIYNIILDVTEGIDLMIEKENHFYAVNLFTHTLRAFNARKKKGCRHTPFHNVIYIDLPVNFKGSLKCGQFFLYGNSEFLYLKKKITDEENKQIRGNSRPLHH